MSDSNSYGFGGKLIVAVIVALLCGYLWACVEMGKSPLALIQKFLPAEEPEPTRTAPKPEPKKPETVAVKKAEPVKVPDPVILVKKPDPLPAAPSTKVYSAIDMSILFNDADDLLRRGKLGGSFAVARQARHKLA